MGRGLRLSSLSGGSLRAALGLAALSLASGIHAAQAQNVIRVPADANLAQAVDQVANGGVIELSPGVYSTPTDGLRVRPRRRSFTLRAVGGGVVAFDGAGNSSLIFVQGTGLENGEVITFEGIVFRNGLSSRESRGGAVSVEAAKAIFRDCQFLSNRAEPPSSGGGAVRLGGAEAEFEGCLWQGNSARNRGGALAVVNGFARLVRNRFLGNGTNVPEHRPTAPGGAIYALDSRVEVVESRFEGNGAGWVGGALYIFGTWQEPFSVPAAEAEIVDSTFVGNFAEGDPCCAKPGLTFGGALHAEDQATVRVTRSRLEDNRANRGGAISSYRAVVEVEDSELRGNQAVSNSKGTGAGGAISATSSDFVDGSTDFGAINRRPAETVIRRSLFEGGPQAASQGGCLQVGGDETRLKGLAGVPQDGGLAENRTRVVVEDSIFFDCDVVDVGPGTGIGGAILMRFADFQMTGSLVLESDAENGGGGLADFGESAVEISDSTFARNRADFGGAMVLLASEVDISDVQFFDNEVTPGVREPFHQSTGAAIHASPIFPPGKPEENRDITGVVRDCLFAGNAGVSILDIDLTEGPINAVRYDGNRFFETFFGGQVYLNTATSGETVAELNALSVFHTGGVRTDKSAVANQSLGSAPRAGQVVAAPSLVEETLPPGDPAPPRPAVLGYAFTGPGALTGRLAGGNLGSRAGLVEVTEAAEYPLTVGGTEVDRAEVFSSNCPGTSALCLNQSRFRVEVSWRDFAGNRGSGEVVPFGSDDSGLFFFFDPDNWEMLVKVLDGCALTNHFWVFAAATTNVEYTLTVTDTVSGSSKSYFNPLGQAAAALTDTAALPVCGASAEAPPEHLASRVPAALPPQRLSPSLLDPVSAPGSSTCAPGNEAMCLQKSRFRVEVDFEDFQGGQGRGKVVPFGSDDSGLFFFFDADNWEMLVKILNGCPLNGHFWVFAAATTNVEYTLRVTDTQTGEAMQYVNPLGVSASAITDTGAFATCP